MPASLTLCFSHIAQACLMSSHAEPFFTSMGLSRVSSSSSKFPDECSEDSEEDSLFEDSSEEEDDEGPNVGGEAPKIQGGSSQG